MRCPLTPRSVLEKEIEWQVAERVLEEKEWQMWSLLNQCGMNIAAPGEEQVLVESIQGRHLDAPTGDPEDPGIFSLDM